MREYERQSRLETTIHHDGGCKAANIFQLEAGRVHVVRFKFERDGECELTCVHLEGRLDGDFDEVPCTEETGEAMAELGANLDGP